MTLLIIHLWLNSTHLLPMLHTCTVDLIVRLIHSKGSKGGVMVEEWSAVCAPCWKNHWIVIPCQRYLVWKTSDMFLENLFIYWTISAAKLRVSNMLCIQFLSVMHFASSFTVWLTLCLLSHVSKVRSFYFDKVWFVEFYSFGGCI